MHRLRQAHSQEAGSGSCSGMVGITTPCFSSLTFPHLPFHSQEWAFILGKLWGAGGDLEIPPGINPPPPNPMSAWLAKLSWKGIRGLQLPGAGPPEGKGGVPPGDTF